MNYLPFIFENKEAPLSDEKNTNVLFAISVSFNFWRIVPTPSSNSRTASPYLTMKIKIYMIQKVTQEWRSSSLMMSHKRNYSQTPLTGTQIFC